MVSRRNKEEGSSATDYVTDVTDVTDVSPSPEGRRKKAHTASFLAACILGLIRYIYFFILSPKI
ncbi:hypothetical protein QT970_19240 [Microcoleus sp. herbarium8]|uniref:hypothetical protein n=1 Tax=Microcoleus sp. herbarium8 TaxID=3055436 RepID=UPI002FCF5A76